MKPKKIVTVLFITVGVATRSSVLLAGQQPIGTAFTYQGLLYDANYVADGQYDFQFKLFDRVDGSQMGSDVNLGEVNVIDGYFTVELDFGNVYDGNERWLEIRVRPGDLNDPNVYTILEPRQEVMPTPYALYAKAAGGDNDWTVSDSNMYSIPSGNVGIGTTNPSGSLYPTSKTLEVEGLAPSIVLDDTDGMFQDDFEVSNGGDKVLFRDATNGVDILTIGLDGNIEGNVGIGTTSPDEKLTVIGGTIKCSTSVSSGKAVYGWATNSGNYTNYGGHFIASGAQGRGVCGEAAGFEGIGVYGWAVASGDYENYGGYFRADGSEGRGVRGYASKSGLFITNYGGDFRSNGANGRGVYGLATGNYGQGVHGEASNTGDYANYGGWFKAAGSDGRGVYGYATGSSGRGVYGYASKTGVYANYGGYFEAAGDYGRGVYGYASDSGDHINYGGHFEAEGGYGRGV